ncbi:MAG: alpha/beta hydrolase, partial [Chloroflexi bacterium]
VIMPCALRYAALLRELDNGVRAITKDLELYAGPGTPPQGYDITMELDGINETAEDAGWDRFHLYGHSGGGAVALAYVAAHPERVLSLAVDEPAYDFLDSTESRGYWSEIDAAGQLPAADRMPAFLKLQLGPGVALPPAPDGTPPPWMASRPAGVLALITALNLLAGDAGSACDAIPGLHSGAIRRSAPSQHLTPGRAGAGGAGAAPSVEPRPGSSEQQLRIHLKRRLCGAMSRFQPGWPAANVQTIDFDGLPSLGEHDWTREPI